MMTWRVNVRAVLISMALAVGALLCQAQTFNVYEGQGVLENAWNNWSWCTVDFQNTEILDGGSYSTKVTYTAAWQGFSLESSTSFPAGYFSALSFSVNGGATAGRSIVVQLVANGAATNAVNLSDYIEGGSVAANTWRHVVIPLSAFGLKPNDSISRFWLQESSGGAQPAFWIDQIGWTPNPAPDSVKVFVNGYTTLRTVDQKMFGVNTAVWDANLISPTCKALIAQGGYQAFRFPGGSLSDGYHWATNTTDANTWTWSTSFDDFASIAVPTTGGQCFITTNYGTGTAAEAAAWVKYANVTKKYGFKYWEVGNECYGGWEEDSHTRKNDPVIYANEFAQYYVAMKAVDPTIQVGAVANPGEDSFANYSDEVVTNPRTGVKHSGWTPVMLATLASLGVTPDFIVYHRYPEYVVDCDFTLLIGNSSWFTDMADLRQQLTDYLGPVNGATQIMCTENNADAGTEGKQMCSVVNGIFMADTFGTILQTECNSFLWWDLINGQNTSGDNGSWLYGWRMYGDEGEFSPDFTQTYPVFYMEQLLNKFAKPGDYVVPTTSSYGLLSAFTTRRASDGTARVLLVNKNPTTAISVSLNIAAYRPQANATVYSYGVAQDNEAKNGFTQSLGVSQISNVGPTTAVTVPPYTAMVIVMNPLDIGHPIHPILPIFIVH